MKKSYITPTVEINETEAEQMMALSLQDGPADESAEVLTKENVDWNIWNEE